MIDRRRLLLGAGAAVVLTACDPGGAVPVVTEDPGPTAGLGSPPPPQPPALWERAAAKGVLFGAHARVEDLTGDPPYADLVARDCLLLTSADFKWGVVRGPELSDFDFAEPDAAAEYAGERDLLLRGHTLVWDRSFRPGVEDRVRSSGDAERLMTEHITRLGERYAGRLHSVDVVNEPIATQQGRPDGLRTKSVWFEAMGATYLDIAFHAAADADPDTLRFLNDFGLETGRPPDFTAQQKRAALLRLLEGMVDRGVPVDALGVQGHLNATALRESFDAEGFRVFLADVAALGLKIMVTELDVNDRDEQGDVAARDHAVAEAYERYLSVVLDEPAVIAVSTWGLADRYSWLRNRVRAQGSQGQRAAEDDRGGRPDGLAVRPLPFDEELAPKAAWTAIAGAFDAAPARDIVSPLPLPRPLRAVPPAAR